MKYTIFPPDSVIDFSKKLKVKFGIDPTSDKLHLGHLIPLLEAKKLWLEGHNVDIVLGNFTAQLGDPSGKDTMRPMLSAEDTEKNAHSITEQVTRIFGNHNENHENFKNIKIHRNGEWFQKMSAIEMVNILSKFTTTQLLSRDSFQKRINANNPIGMHELVVPILQGFDSVHLKTNLEIGGNDQLFNFSITRDVQRVFGQTPEICMLMPIINGTDDRKMSKSFDNCIFINDTPRDVFGKTMSISDEMMKEWWSVFIGDNLRFGIETHPMEMKKELAFHITDIIWGEDAAKNEFDQFETLIQKKCLPDEIMEIKLPLQGGISIIDIITQTRNCSKNEARRLIDGKGVRLITELGDNTVIASGDSIFIMPGTIIKVGKRDFVKLI
jgi:tyrosyl-tRNA synthetase